MKTITIHQDPRVALKFQDYPEVIKSKLYVLRELILETATENAIEAIEETLKWGEPSYLAKKGSTVRIDWKAKTPDQYAMYFKCTSKLIPSFKDVYGDTFTYEKNRAIVFKLHDAIPKEALKSCIAAALNYHTVKNKPFLGL